MGCRVSRGHESCRRHIICSIEWWAIIGKRKGGGGVAVEEFPWDNYLNIALGKMQMSKNDFWDMSMYEFNCALEGFAEFHSGGQPSALSKNELDELMELNPD